MPGDALEIIATLVIILAWGLRAMLTPLARRRKRRQQTQQTQQQSQPTQRQAARHSAEQQAARDRQRRQRGPVPGAKVRPAEPIVAPPPPPIVAPPPPPPGTGPSLPESAGPRSLTADLLRELGLDVEQTTAPASPPPLPPPPPALIPEPSTISATATPRRTGGGLNAPASLIKTVPKLGPVQVLALDELSADAALGFSGPTLAQEVLRDLRGGPRTLARAVLLAEILGPAPGLRSPEEGSADRRW